MGCWLLMVPHMWDIIMGLVDGHNQVRQFYPYGALEALRIALDRRTLYLDFDSFSKSGRPRREAGPDHGAVVRG